MFGIIDRISKESRVFCVLNDRTSNNLMKIIKDNIVTNENHDMDLDEEHLENTRIYSDCFASYQPSTFLENGYILKELTIVYGSDMEISIKIMLKAYGLR